jgi:hypothetical protein
MEGSSTGNDCDGLMYVCKLYLLSDTVFFVVIIIKSAVDSIPFQMCI